MSCGLSVCLCLAQVGINGNLTISRLSWGFPGEIIPCDNTFATDTMQGLLREYSLIAHSECHHSAFVPSSIIASTFSDFSTTTNNKLVKTMGPIPPLHPPRQHFVPRTLNGIIDGNTTPILSSVARDPMLINFLPLVYLVGSVLQHFPI